VGCGLNHSAVSIQGRSYRVPKCREIDELKWIQKESHGLIHVLSRNLRGDTEENYEILNEDNQCPNRYSDRTLLGYETRALSLCQPVGAGPPYYGLCGYGGNLPN
jgi:hypothetical protein